MAVLQKEKAANRPPSYYIRQRLLQNKPAMVGLGIILLAIVVAILGYAIMPDSTPNANNGLVQIQKKNPGFSTQVLRITKVNPAEDVNPLAFMLFGAPEDYSEIPIESYSFKGDSLQVQPLRSNNAMADQPRTFALKEIVGDSENNSSVSELQQSIQNEHIRNKTFWLGTDKAGRDVLSRLILGTRISLGIGFVAVLISLVVGIAVGAAGGYFGGGVDKLMTFLMTVVWSVPSIMLVIAISLALDSKGVWVAFVAVGLTMWVEVARVVRGQILGLKEKTYIEAAQVLGVPERVIILRHLLPNMMGPLIVIATANFASAILIEAGLSFLGLGVQPPAPSWGMMVNEGFQLIGAKAGLYLVLLPSLCISVLVLAFNLLGNGLRDAYDPKIPLTNG
ncbi:ABC transporter permease [Pontibacter sp. BT310]|uniref:ABC transporter permease n=1 Tax=Pontibacter populi TaxID=890055 RepID=A0ABS6XBF9_9BACT|nr:MULTISPECIES: ABC transporter permease [Pontibacter]MBJ6118479.1 ABC transporter permease [Pontibacter sp. BT310]MBR0570908.1 ABC transporter permease [Microvirga sp. STS03]MBW3365333.1 ABC transporter permease [Pontibacter populi]